MLLGTVSTVKKYICIYTYELNRTRVLLVVDSKDKRKINHGQIALRAKQQRGGVNKRKLLFRLFYFFFLQACGVSVVFCGNGRRQEKDRSVKTDMVAAFWTVKPADAGVSIRSRVDRSQELLEACKMECVTA
jgi:hypothetical protein